jgi:hypothetical protein
MEGKPTNLHPLEHGKVAPRGGKIPFSSFVVSDGDIIRASDAGWRPLVLGTGSSLPIGKNRHNPRRHRLIAAFASVDGNFIDCECLVVARTIAIFVSEPCLGRAVESVGNVLVLLCR